MPTRETLGDIVGGEKLAEIALGRHGYSELEITARGGEFIASAAKIVSGNRYRAEAIGRTRQIAAQQLVKVVERR